MDEDKMILNIAAAVKAMQDHIQVANESIQPERTPEFVETANAASKFIQDLRLPSDQNNQLVALLLAHSQEAERSGFLSGFDLGVKLGKHFSGNPENKAD